MVVGVICNLQFIMKKESESYSRFLQTCLLRGFTFTFTVQIIVQFLYQDGTCGTNPLFQFLYRTVL
jgi:hypothetical protein